MTAADDQNRQNAIEAKQKASLSARQRVVEEIDDLKGKVDRLHSFVNGTGYYEVSDNQKGLLKAQLVHKKSYLDILQARLKNWE